MLGEILWFFEANWRNSGFLSQSTQSTGLYTSLFFSFFSLWELNSGPCTTIKLSSHHFKSDIHVTFTTYNLRQLFTICQLLCFTKLPTFSCHHLSNAITQTSFRKKEKQNQTLFFSVLWLGFIYTTKTKIIKNYFERQKQTVASFLQLPNNCFCDAFLH